MTAMLVLVVTRTWLFLGFRENLNLVCVMKTAAAE